MKFLKDIGIIREFAGDLNNNYNTTIIGSNEIALKNITTPNKEIKYNKLSNYYIFILIASIFLLMFLILYIYNIECNNTNSNTNYKIINTSVK